MKLLHAVLAASITTSALAQQPFTDPANLRGERVKPHDGRELPIDQGAGGLQQLLRKLNTRASILNIVAHPDDEDGGMMAFYSRGLGARVADLSLTRGEGGQNAMTGDFEDALGLLRTQELLSSDRFPGVDQFFGTEVDFGFSKTKEEAFQKWTHERLLYDAVRAIRLYRPLVLTSTWIGGVTDGHGQHQASGQIAQEAFNAAGDPNVFPDMIAEGILPWQPLKIYARVPTQSVSDKGLFDYATGQYLPARFVNYVTGEVSTTVPSVDVVVHEGATDTMLTEQSGGAGTSTAPLSYVQFARLGLGQQKSQIPAGFRMPPVGAFDVSYHRYGSKLKDQPQQESSFFDGIDTNIDGIAALTGVPSTPLQHVLHNVSLKIEAATKAFDPQEPAAIAPQLADALHMLDSALNTVHQFKLGSHFAKENIVHELTIKRIQLNDALVLALGPKLDAVIEEADIVKGSSPIIHITATQIPDEPQVCPHILGYSGVFAFSDVITSHPPPIQINPKLPAELASKVTEPYFARTSIEQPVYGLRDKALRNAPATPAPLVAAVAYEYKGTTLDVDRIVHSGLQSAVIVAPDATTYRSIGYADLPRTIYYPLPPKHVSLTHLALPTKRRIAYLPGTGDAVPEALASIGLTPTLLTVADLTPAKLSSFDTIVLGVRTYAAHPDLHGAPTQALMDYARSGGNVLVQYQTAEFTAADAPYPLTLGRDAEKVVDETAPVKLLLPAQPGTAPGGIQKDTPSPTPTMEYALLNTPNTVTSADFDGWVSERGHGFLRTWDAHYAALTETHDPGSVAEGVLPQEPQRGGLVTTPLGRGRWTYCAFALYRQLPEAVPGAFRIFVNLLTP